MVVVVLFTAGDQIPVKALVEDVGSVNVPPEQIGAIVLNVGVAGGPTLTVRVAVAAHCPELGVKV